MLVTQPGRSKRGPAADKHRAETRKVQPEIERAPRHGKMFPAFRQAHPQYAAAQHAAEVHNNDNGVDVHFRPRRLCARQERKAKMILAAAREVTAP